MLGTMTRRDWLRTGFAGAAAIALPAAARAEDPPSPAGQPEGRIYVYADLDLGEGQVLRGPLAIDPAGGSWTKISDTVANRFRVSPDGKRLTYTEDKVEDGYSKPVATFVKDLADGEPRKLADFGGLALWSADGKTLLISHALEVPRGESRRWRFEHWMVPVDGSAPKKLALREDDEIDDWSADGEWLVSVSSHQLNRGGYQLDVLHPDGTGRRRITEGAGTNVYPRISPDGRRVAYFHGEKGKSALRVVNRDGTGMRDVLPEKDLTSPEYAAWSPDGRFLAVTIRTFKLDDQGRKVFGSPDEASLRLVVVPSDGQGEARTISLPATRWLGHPQWLSE